MRIAFCPYAKDNFYQRHLAQELEKLGASVESLAPRRLLLWGCAATRKVDVLHIHWTDQLLVGRSWLGSLARSTMCIGQLCLCRLLGRRIVWTAHNLSSHDRRFPRTERLFTRLLAQLAHRVIAHSNAAAAQVAQAFRIPMSKICVIPHAHYVGDYPNSIDRSAARNRLGIDDQNFVFLFLGNIRSYKGLADLVEAFRALDRDDVRLLVAGRPFEEQAAWQVREWAAGDPRIDYRPGFVEADMMEVYFNAADVVVLPFTDILTSGSLLLAMSFAKPCIVPDLDTLTEVVPADGGFVYDAQQSAALAAALHQAIERRAELPAMGQASLRAVADWGWPQMAEATYQAYAAIA